MIRNRCVCAKDPHLAGCPAWTPDHSEQTIMADGVPVTCKVKDGKVYAVRVELDGYTLRGRLEA